MAKLHNVCHVRIAVIFKTKKSNIVKDDNNYFIQKICLTNYIFTRKIFCGFSWLAHMLFKFIQLSSATLTLACHRKRISIITHIVLLPQLRSLAHMVYIYIYIYIYSVQLAFQLVQHFPQIYTIILTSSFYYILTRNQPQR